MTTLNAQACRLCDRMGILPSLGSEDTAAGEREPVLRWDVPCPACVSGEVFAVTAKRHRPARDDLPRLAAWRESGATSYAGFVTETYRAAWEEWREAKFGPRAGATQGPLGLGEAIARLEARSRGEDPGAAALRADRKSLSAGGAA